MVGQAVRGPSVLRQCAVLYGGWALIFAVVFLALCTLEFVARALGLPT